MPRRILVVDDDPDTLNILTAIISAAGYEVLKARNGTQAVDLAINAAPDAIVMDVMMPDVSGYDALRQIRTITDEPPPVIFLTAKSQIQDRVEGLEMGAFRYLVKPTPKERLLEAVTAALESRKSG